MYVVISVLLAVSAVTIYYMILKNNKTAFTVAFISSFWAIFATFFSYLFFYNETINAIQMFGLVLYNNRIIYDKFKIKVICIKFIL